MAGKAKIHPTPVVGGKLSPPSPLHGLAALGQIVEAAREFGVVYQTEHTKRTQIKVYADLEIRRIKAAESVLKDYFEQVFAERRSNFDNLFARLDVALTEHDGESVNRVIRGIVDIARASPLAELGDLSQIRAALDDPDQVWDI